MKLVDANLLLYARDHDSRQHARAREWLEQVLNGPARVGIPWQSTLAFLRIATHPRASANPLSADEARAQVTEWLAAPAAWVPTPTARHWTVLDDLIGSGELRGNLIPDAHLAALAIEHGLELCSADSDFARFSDVRWTNPLV